MDRGRSVGDRCALGGYRAWLAVIGWLALGVVAPADGAAAQGAASVRSPTARGSAELPGPDAARVPTPRVIAYYNAPTDPVLAGVEQQPYTHIILAFLVPDGAGGVEPSPELRKALADPAAIRRVQAAGKRVLVSIGGGRTGGAEWLTLGRNAAAVSETVAALVKRFELDGVDLDVEAVPYQRRSEFEPYADAVVALTNELALRLPGKLLTHAPQPPYLCAPGSSGECPEDSLYAAILAATGNNISWLNMQYYSNPPLTSSPVDEVASYESIVEGWPGFPGLSPRRLVVGKPYSSRVSGFAARGEVIGQVLAPLRQRYGSSFGGFMAWELNQDHEGEWAAAVSAILASPLAAPEP